MMKKLLILSALFIFSTVLFAQDEYNTERGVELYMDQNYIDALPYLQKAAKAGNPRAQTFLGNMYRWGEGTSSNAQIAINMYTKAIAQKYPAAMTQLGNMYENGDGIARNPAKAFEMYKKAADLEYGYGLYQVGLCYQYGYAVTKDPEKAFDYCRQAVEKETQAAYETMGDYYYEGIGSEQNISEALKWYQKAESDYFLSYRGTCRYAENLYKGNGINADPLKAKELLTAIAEKSEDAAKLLPEVSKAAEQALFRKKMETLYQDSWKGCIRYTLSEGDCYEHPSGKGKCYRFTNGKRLKVKNHFYHNDLFSITFWIKDFSSGSIVETVKSNDFRTESFPCVNIHNNRLTFIPGPYADVKTAFNYPLSSLNNGQWHLIAVTFGRKIKKMYVDGKLVGQMNADTSQISQGDVVYLGGGDMKLSNIRLYAGNILSQEEIQSIYLMESEGK